MKTSLGMGSREMLRISTLVLLPFSNSSMKILLHREEAALQRGVFQEIGGLHQGSGRGEGGFLEQEEIVPAHPPGLARIVHVVDLGGDLHAVHGHLAQDLFGNLLLPGGILGGGVELGEGPILEIVALDVGAADVLVAVDVLEGACVAPVHPEVVPHAQIAVALLRLRGLEEDQEGVVGIAPVEQHVEGLDALARLLLGQLHEGGGIGGEAGVLLHPGQDFGSGRRGADSRRGDGQPCSRRQDGELERDEVS